MKDLLVRLGKRFHDLRVSRKWSQEEFAHVSGLHRTYIGQIERGEKNISFGNLVKLSSVLGMTMSDLLSGLEDNAEPATGTPASAGRDLRSSRRTLEIKKVLRQLRVQQAALDRTLESLEKLTGPSTRESSGPRGKSGGRRSG